MTPANTQQPSSALAHGANSRSSSPAAGEPAGWPEIADVNGLSLRIGGVLVSFAVDDDEGDRLRDRRMCALVFRLLEERAAEMQSSSRRVMAGPYHRPPAPDEGSPAS